MNFLIDRKYLIGIVLGFMIGVMWIPIDATIPPTPAIQTITVMTSGWFINDTDVNIDSWDDTIFFVTDGSIEFNVTDSYP